MSFQALQERLAQLQDSAAQLKTLIDRLANLKLQPGSVPLGSSVGGEDADPDNVCSELIADITQGLREGDDELDLLREEIIDLRSGPPESDLAKSKARLSETASQLGDELKSCRVSFRKAVFSAKQGLAAAQRAERAALLTSYAATPPPPPSLTEGSRSGASSPGIQQQQQFQRRHPRKHPRSSTTEDKDDGVVGAAHDVTASLRRTHDLMAAELARSAYASQALAESTAALSALDDRYQGLDSMLASTRNLLVTLMSSQKSDTWYLQTAFCMLLATLAWLVFRRLLYGPMWWLVWQPLRILWWGAGKGVGGGVALVGKVGSGGDGSSSIASIVGGTESPTASAVQVVGGGSAQVGDKGGSGEAEDPDSLVEKVGKIVEGGHEADQEGGQDADDVRPNPKKRMWEDKEATREQTERVKDEL